VIVYTGRDLTAEDKARLDGLAQTVIIKDVTTMERLLDETALFLHRVEANLPERKQRVLRRLAKSDPQLADRTVLVVDDDLRNIFALTSLLEGHKMHVQYAENGRRAVAKLEKNPHIDVVLMDIMMPEMDGYEALRKIRECPKWKTLPVIALTAKAMKGDRQKCLEAGASDYITKPVDADQLLSCCASGCIRRKRARLLLGRSVPARPLFRFDRARRRVWSAAHALPRRRRSARRV